MKVCVRPTVPVLFLICFLAAINTSAATLVVTKTADTSDGVCDADCSLREAVATAASGDVVVFSTLFNQPQTITLINGQILIDKNLTMGGPGSGLLSISGNNAGRIFRIMGGAVVGMSEITIRDGRVEAQNNFFGAGIYITDSYLSLSNVVIRNNFARFSNTSTTNGYGAGITSISSSVTAINILLTENTSTAQTAIAAEFSKVVLINATVTSNNGGGVGSDSLVIRNSRFENNTGTAVIGSGSVTNSTVLNNGGTGISSLGSLTVEGCRVIGNRPGIANVGYMRINDSLISNNQSTVFTNGGGVSNIGTMYIFGSAITDNRANGGGGGIYHGTGQLYVTNSTISGNRAVSGLVSSSLGGGIYGFPDTVVTSGTITLINTTIANNSAFGRGGGILKGTRGTLTIRNSIISGNIANNSSDADVSGAIISDGVNLVGNTTGSSGWIAADLLNTNPLLSPLGSNGGTTPTHALLPGSPAINSGNDDWVRDPLTGVPFNFDQRGSPSGRLIIHVDIGAYETFYATTPVTVSGRITTPSGRSIFRARITVTPSSGSPITVQTNPFGYFRLINLMPGTVYTVGITHKYYSFATPQFITAERNRSDLNFMSF